jgi:hypothetical protein
VSRATDTRASAAWLDESASGLRHLRWARELRGSIDGYLELDEEGALDGADPKRRGDLDAAKGELSSIRVELGHAIDRLSAAVKDYRDFLERRRTEVRGRSRAALALGLAPDGRLARFDALEREPRRLTVRAEVRWLRQAVRELLARLDAYPALRDSLLPPLADPHHVADADDVDDDATAAPR